MNKKDKRLGPSRRELFRRGMAATAGVIAGPLLLARSARAAKVTKAAASYQDHPHHGEQCRFCAHFVAGRTAFADGTCTLVEGSITPRGWCTLFLGVH